MSFISPASLKQYNLNPGLPSVGLWCSSDDVDWTAEVFPISILHRGTLWPLGSMETNSDDAASGICNTTFFHSCDLDKSDLYTA